MTNTVLKKLESTLVDRLPQVRGRRRAQASLKEVNWFGVGGVAEMLFKPEDTEDLAHFLKHKPADVPVTVIGVGSNLLVRDGGIRGVTIRLGRGFAGIETQDDCVMVGGAALDVHVAQVAADAGIAGLEFLSGIPGTVGGALRMNGGAYGSDISQVLVEATAVDGQGALQRVAAVDMQYDYRHCGLPEGWIFTGATLRGTMGDAEEINARIQQIAKERGDTQPIKSRTGGSTFKNPEGHKAWQLIDAAGCRGLQMGGAQVSEKHCNFFINTGNATAQDIESLGEEVRARVLAHSGITLEWEIKRIGDA